MLTLKLLFAGLWPLVWHWGVGAGLIILCGVGAYFSPLYKKDFIYAAIIVAIALFFEAVGIHDEQGRVAAQQATLNNAVNSIVEGTETPAAKGKRDKYDSPNN